MVSWLIWVGCGPISNDGTDTDSAGDADTDADSDADADTDADTDVSSTGETGLEGGTTVTGRFGIDTVAAATWTGGPDDQIQTVASAGDLDGDGFEDLALGAPRADNGSLQEAGLVALVYGEAAPSGDTEARTLPSFVGEHQSDLLAEYGNVAGVGDLDNDGLGDLMMGTRFWDTLDGYGGFNVGLVGILYGSSLRETGIQGMDGLDATFVPPEYPDYMQMGTGIAGLGDVDGDGFADASFAEMGTTGFPGTIYLLYGSSERPSGEAAYADLPHVTTEVAESMGHQQGIAGTDLDGDGLSDVLIGGHRTGVPTLAVIYGDPVRPDVLSTSSLLQIVDGAGPIVTYGPMTHEFGHLVRAVGDLDGNGYDDVLVADHNHTSQGGLGSGQAWVLGGDASRWTGSEELATEAFATIEGMASSMQCAWDARGLGDFSGDGADDLAVSCLGWNQPYTYAGAVGIFRGTLGGSIGFGTADLLFEGATGSADLGFGLAAADVNGDGWVDLAAAADGAVGLRGRVYLVLGGSL